MRIVTFAGGWNSKKKIIVVDLTLEMSKKNALIVIEQLQESIKNLEKSESSIEVVPALPPGIKPN